MIQRDANGALVVPAMSEEDMAGLPRFIDLGYWRGGANRRIDFMVAVGRGAFPYDCAMKQRHPNAMIYQNGSGGWASEADERFKGRAKLKTEAKAYEDYLAWVAQAKHNGWAL